MSYITPLYKTGSRVVPGNYRPVSLTSHVVKIFERIVRKQLVTYLENNNLLCQQQHGFRVGHSCLTQLLHHVDDIMQNLKGMTQTVSIWVMLKHLIGNWTMLCWSGLVAWVESFLTNRTQQVVVDGHMSRILQDLSGHTEIPLIHFDLVQLLKLVPPHHIKMLWGFS